MKGSGCPKDLGLYTGANETFQQAFKEMCFARITSESPYCSMDDILGKNEFSNIHF